MIVRRQGRQSINQSPVFKPACRGAEWWFSVTFHMVPDRVQGLGNTVQGLAGEVFNPSTDGLVFSAQPAVLQALNINEMLDKDLVPTLRERLTEIGEIQVHTANKFHNADASIDTVMGGDYTTATGEWVVEAPKWV
jgi:hypothetical protein